jgi:hypothetical protein
MSLLEKSLKIVANRMMKDVGSIRELHVDTRAKTCSALLLLAGETEPVTLDVGAYQLLREDSKVTLQLRDITCSKEWMERLAGRLEPQMNIGLPRAISYVLKLARVA